MKLENVLEIGKIFGKETVEDAIREAIARLSTSRYEIDREISELIAEWGSIKEKTVFGLQSSCDDVLKRCFLKKDSRVKANGYLFEDMHLELDEKLIATGSISELTTRLKEEMQSGEMCRNLSLYFVHKGEILEMDVNLAFSEAYIRNSFLGVYEKFSARLGEEDRHDMSVLCQEIDKCDFLLKSIKIIFSSRRTMRLWGLTISF